MANNPNIYPYPLQFDPSQWSNKYSPFNGKALPSLAAYSGTPTDAHGNPIGSYQAFQAQQPSAPAAAQGTTLNSNPSSTSGQWGALYPGGPAVWQGGGGPQGHYVQTSPGGMLPSGENYGTSSPTYIPAQYQFMPNAAPAAAPQAPPTQAPDMGQAYLAALSNPGKVTTPGATVPQAQLPSANSGVLQAFLQNWQNKGSPTTGAGNYNNAGFFNALQGGQPSA
jgi:hypothetical protein